ncbi:MAG TPA: J domain-containing protein [Candidatus Sumerlaeota bacterium]|nr:J domain-containing protein [Candidatus Sumerlaeota bacterium]
MKAPQIKDLYQILGVSENAGTDEIKKAYRKLAIKYHPDRNRGNKRAEERFKEINEAHHILSDENKRRQYDAMRKNPGGFHFDPRRGATSPDGSFEFSMDDLGSIFSGFGGLDDIFSFFSGGGQRKGKNPFQPHPMHGQDARVNLAVPFLTALKGGKQTVQLQDPSGGRRPRTITINIPAGISEGQTLRLAGQGEPGPGGGTSGDLLIQISIEPHPDLRRIGDDLESDVAIGLEEAVLGGQATVETLHGPMLLKVPAGTQQGTRFRMKGAGPHFSDGRKGDHYAVARVSIPRRLTAEQKRLFQSFADSMKK